METLRVQRGTLLPQNLLVFAISFLVRLRFSQPPSPVAPAETAKQLQRVAS